MSAIENKQIPEQLKDIVSILDNRIILIKGTFILRHFNDKMLIDDDPRTSTLAQTTSSIPFKINEIQNVEMCNYSYLVSRCSDTYYSTVVNIIYQNRCYIYENNSDDINILLFNFLLKFL